MVELGEAPPSQRASKANMFMPALLGGSGHASPQPVRPTNLLSPTGQALSTRPVTEERASDTESFKGGGGNIGKFRRMSHELSVGSGRLSREILSHSPSPSFRRSSDEGSPCRSRSGDGSLNLVRRESRRTTTLGEQGPPDVEALKAMAEETRIRKQGGFFARSWVAFKERNYVLHHSSSAMAIWEWLLSLLIIHYSIYQPLALVFTEVHHRGVLGRLPPSPPLIPPSPTPPS